jgi:superfamily II DNA helicase RecQ
VGGAFAANMPSGNYPANPGTVAGKRKVDYKEILSKENFDLYLALRDLRKLLAAEDGVALYAVFTNDHLAQMVERRVRTKADIEQITGIGESRIDKYGTRVLELLNNLRKAEDETGGPASRKDR